MCTMSPAPSISYSITVRLEFAAHSAAVSEITRSIEEHGGSVTALDVSASGPERMRADITVMTAGNEHAMEVVDALRHLDGRLVGGRVVVVASEHRSQHRNRVAARERLAALLREAVAPPPPPRRPTRPTRSSQRRRLDAKRRRGETKALRGRVRD